MLITTVLHKQWKNKLRAPYGHNTCKSLDFKACLLNEHLFKNYQIFIYFIMRMYGKAVTI